MAETKIEWTDRTWNPIRGCSMAKGSETGGCLNCYAARMAARNLPELKSPTTGEPFARILPAGPRWTGKVELIDHLLTAPSQWKKPQKIFVNSMSDLWHEDLPLTDIARVYAQMYIAHRHTYQVLTKRPEKRLAAFGDPAFWALVSSIAGRECQPAAPYIWEGVSVENQAMADVRIPLLLQTPAAIRFVSYEPALGPVNFRPWLGSLDWIIIGGESGPGARPFDIEWARDTVRQFREAGLTCFVKQMGAVPVSNKEHFGLQRIRFKDRKGADWSEWEPDLRVREFPRMNLT